MFRVAIRGGRGGYLSLISQLRLSRCQSVSTDTYDHDKVRQFLLQLGEGSVDLTQDEKTGVAVIVLNNPKKKNALSGKMMVDLSDIITDLERWSMGRGILLYGLNHNFCAGGDLTLVKSAKNGEFCQLMQDTLNRLYQLPLVSVSLVEGKALGGGAEIACASDFRAMSTSSMIGFVQVKLSVSPGFGSGARLVQILGRTKALHLLASGRLLNSDEFKSFGLADIVVPDGAAAVEKALEFLQTVTAGSPTAVQSAKQVVVNASKFDIEEAMDGERRIFKSVWGSPEHLSALEGGTKFTKNS